MGMGFVAENGPLGGVEICGGQVEGFAGPSVELGEIVGESGGLEAPA